MQKIIAKYVPQSPAEWEYVEKKLFEIPKKWKDLDIGSGPLRGIFLTYHPGIVYGSPYKKIKKDFFISIYYTDSLVDREKVFIPDSLEEFIGVCAGEILL